MQPSTHTALRIATKAARSHSPALSSTPAAPYLPYRGSVVWELMCFFGRCPDEELTGADVVVKFGSSIKQLHTRTELARAAGYLASRVQPTPKSRGVAVYSAGPALATGLRAIAERWPHHAAEVIPPATSATTAPNPDDTGDLHA